TTEHDERTGLITKTTYDGLDRVTRVERIPGHNQPPLVTTTTYWAGGEPHVVTLAPDTAGETQPTFELDGRSRVHTITKVVSDPTPGHVGPGQETLRWVKDYDENGNVVREEDPRHVVLRHVYDDLDRPWKTLVDSGVPGEG